MKVIATRTCLAQILQDNCEGRNAVMKVCFEVHRYTLDWFEWDKKEIETDDYNYFIIQCRGQDNDWYLTGYKWNETLKRFDYESFNILYLRRMVEIYHQIKNKVKQIDVLHFTSGENDSIQQFFDAYNKYLSNNT